MYKKVLVPLDGSKNAEQALPVAAHLAQATGCTIVLLHAVSSVYGYGPYLLRPPFEGETIFTRQAMQAKSYLDQKAREPVFSGLSVKSEVMLGTAVGSIHAYAHHHEIDLILLCRHGYTGLKRWPMGNVAYKITQSSNIPVLVLQKESDISTKLYDQHGGIRALIGLDGSHLAEATLVPTAYLVSCLSTSNSGMLHLTTVLKSPVASSKGKQAAFPPPEEQRDFSEALMDEKIETYLKSVVERLENTLAHLLNFQVTWSVVKSADIAQGLIEMAEQGKDAHAPYDMIAVATHGSGALQRWILGSVAERVLTGARLPVLIVRPEKEYVPQVEMQEQIHHIRR